MTNNPTTYDRFVQASPANRRLVRQEELILDVTEVLLTNMNRLRVSKTELARRLGRSKGFVSQLLAGGRNLTLRTLADLADALGERVEFSLVSTVSRRAMMTNWTTAPPGLVKRWPCAVPQGVLPAPPGTAPATGSDEIAA